MIIHDENPNQGFFRAAGGGGQDRGTGQEICGEGLPSNHTVSSL